MLQNFRAHRRLILALALLSGFAASLLVLPAPTTATTRTGHDFTYYTDATHAHPVGYCFVCVGYSGCNGQITPFYRVGNYPCN